MDPVTSAAPEDRPSYETSRPDVRRLVPAQAISVLDLGCSSGALGAALKQERPELTVVGVELSAEFAAVAAGRLDRVVNGDVESFLAGEPPSEAPFDCLLAADLLEHLVDPWTTLRQAVSLLRPGGTAIVSVPNVFYFRTLGPALLRRRWPREAEGVFDRTHLRWFGPEDARDLLSGAGLVDVVVRPNYWLGEPWLSIARKLARTPLGDYLPAQHLVTGVAPDR